MARTVTVKVSKPRKVRTIGGPTFTLASGEVISAKLATFVDDSKNAKIGTAAALYVSIKFTCPTEGSGGCLHRDNGTCYVPGTYTTNKINVRLERAGDALETDGCSVIRAAIDAITADYSGKYTFRGFVSGQLHCQVCAAEFNACMRDVVVPRYASRHGGSTFGAAWIYLHDLWKVIDASAWTEGLNVNASCDTAADVELAIARGYAPTIVGDGVLATPVKLGNGYRAVQCPQQVNKVADCASCPIMCRNTKGAVQHKLINWLDIHSASPVAIDKLRTAGLLFTRESVAQIGA